ncbi:hypothetical protein CALVIDRAFT_534804 [Calocera viscosa TUFC12733]|uniref:Uncharacterized protein n=1 Tax=Calocera viscosa (strain TUFC12733) TaxID=1330018 RepID=A0A167PEP0_CALVF|nr:hypothetical protein CALVIDRAFT_534804 [Calocera viscosa TUFC12733]
MRKPTDVLDVLSLCPSPSFSAQPRRMVRTLPPLHRTRARIATREPELSCTAAIPMPASYLYFLCLR